MMQTQFLPKDPDWKIFENYRSPVTYQAGQMIYLQGDTPAEFYYLVSGSVTIFMTSESGAQRTLTVMESGNIFGEASFFDGLDRVSSACAATDCRIIGIDNALLTECFSREPELAVTMLRYLSRTVRMLSDQLDTISFLPANKRIARILLGYDELNPGRPISCTQEELGNRTGASRVTVSRALNDFAHRGLIEIKYRRIRVTDRAGLTAYMQAEEDA